jgi:hypothetical protein
MKRPTHKQIADALADLVGGVTEMNNFISGAYHNALSDKQHDDDNAFLSLEATPRDWWLMLSHLEVAKDVLICAAAILREVAND